MHILPPNIVVRFSCRYFDFNPYVCFFGNIYVALGLTGAYLKNNPLVQFFINFNALVVKLPHLAVKPLVTLLRLSSVYGFSTLVDIAFYDKPQHWLRFSLIYTLRSRSGSVVLTIRTAVRNFCGVFSLTALFANADWSEREAMEMLGVIFIGNHSLSCLLKEYGFLNYPLRKDFNLSGSGNVQSADSVSFGGMFFSAKHPIVESAGRVF